VLLVGASMLLKTLLDMQNARNLLDTRHVLAINLPVNSYGKTPEQINHFYEEVVQRVSAMPGADSAAVADTIPWRVNL
jgi:hypothetical protein